MRNMKDYDTINKIEFTLKHCPGGDDSEDSEDYYYPLNIPEAVQNKYEKLFRGSVFVMTLIPVEGKLYITILSEDIFEELIQKIRMIDIDNNKRLNIWRCIVGSAI